MSKNANFKNYPLSNNGVATALSGTSAPSFAVAPGNTNGVMTMCATCGLFLPRNAGHQDVVAHPCFRGFSIALTAAGEITLS